MLVLVVVVVVVVVLENPNVLQSGERNKKIAGQMGVFAGTERQWTEDENDSQTSEFGLSATRHEVFQKITVGYTENLIVDQGRSSQSRAVFAK